MSRRAIVRRIPSLSLTAVQEGTTVGIGITFVETVILLSVRAIPTLDYTIATGISLGANADTISDLNVLDIFADSNCFADDLVAYHAWI
jgi:hypothetical protein